MNDKIKNNSLYGASPFGEITKSIRLIDRIIPSFKEASDAMSLSQVGEQRLINDCITRKLHYFIYGIKDINFDFDNMFNVRLKATKRGMEFVLVGKDSALVPHFA